MAKSKQQFAHDDEFTVPANSNDAMELSEKLYDQFFDEKDATKKREIMKRYNLCVVFINNDAGRKLVVPLSMKSKYGGSDETTNAAPPPVSMSEFEADIPADTVDSSKKLRVVKKTGTKKPTAKKAAKKSAAPATSTAKPEAGRFAGEPKPGTKTAQILEHHKKGKSNKEIIEMGFTPSVVSWQISLFKKREAERKAKK